MNMRGREMEIFCVGSCGAMHKLKLCVDSRGCQQPAKLSGMYIACN